MLNRFSHRAMNCDWGMTLVEADARYAQQAAREAFSEVDRLERELSRFVPESDISRLNAAVAGAPLRLGPDAFACLELAIELTQQTGGAFDVAVGSLVPGRHDADAVFPAAGAESGAASGRAACDESARCVAGGITLDRAARTATRQAAGVVVDLGAIGKGFAVDAAAERLRAWKITAALVHSGQSSVYALGAPPGEACWKVDIRDPRDPQHSIRSEGLRDRAIGGSGRAIHGDHIIDPRCGRPATARIGAWAIADTAARADAISTAFMVMSIDEIRAFVRRHAETIALVQWEQRGQQCWLDSREVLRAGSA